MGLLDTYLKTTFHVSIFPKLRGCSKLIINIFIILYICSGTSQSWLPVNGVYQKKITVQLLTRCVNSCKRITTTTLTLCTEIYLVSHCMGRIFRICAADPYETPVCPVAFTFLLLLQENKPINIKPLQETQKMQVPLGVFHLRTINYLRVLYRRESILAIVVFPSLPLFSQAKSCFSVLSFWVNISLE